MENLDKIMDPRKKISNKHKQRTCKTWSSQEDTFSVVYTCF